MALLNKSFEGAGGMEDSLVEWYESTQIPA